LSHSADSHAPNHRSIAKSASRAVDRAAVARGQQSVYEVKQANEAFAPFAVGARIDLNASRRLA
jgi:hypothetical protein